MRGRGLSSWRARSPAWLRPCPPVRCSMANQSLSGRLLQALDLLESLVYTPSKHAAGLAKLEAILAEFTLGVDGAPPVRLDRLYATQEGFETNSRLASGFW